MTKPPCSTLARRDRVGVGTASDPDERGGAFDLANQATVQGQCPRPRRAPQQRLPVAVPCGEPRERRLQVATVPERRDPRGLHTVLAGPSDVLEPKPREVEFDQVALRFANPTTWRTDRPPDSGTDTPTSAARERSGARSGFPENG